MYELVIRVHNRGRVTRQESSIIRPPDTKATIRVGRALEEAARVESQNGPADGDPGDYGIELEFVDAAGTRWKRTAWRGQLIRLPESIAVVAEIVSPATGL